MRSRLTQPVTARNLFIYEIHTIHTHVYTGCRKTDGKRRACSTSKSADDVGDSAAVMNCSDTQLTEFPPSASTAADVAVQTLDLSHNRLTVVRADRLRALYPGLCVLLLHDNLVTSLPVALVDGSLTSLTLAGNPLTPIGRLC